MSDKPDLEQVIRHYGGDITGLHGNRLILCVVHDESVPSLSVNLDKGLMLCHSCGFRGDSISLIQEKEHCDYPSAIRWATSHLDYAPGPSHDGSRVGLSGQPRASRGGYKPRVRRRAGLTSG